jgi:hypothetical protein
MECDRCEKLYVVVQRLPDPRQRSTPGFYLVLREHHERNEAYRAAERARIDGVKRDYGAALVSALAGFSSRRALFDELQRRDFFLGSFNFFNELMKEQGRAAVIHGLVRRENLDPIARLLGLPESTFDR